MIIRRSLSLSRQAASLLWGLCLVALCVGPALAQQPPGSPSKLWIEKTARAKEEPLRAESFAQLAEDVSPSVVNILVTVSLDGSMPDDLEAPPSSPRGGVSGWGSGFIIHPEGYILTNNHVVENATAIRVRLNDKREYDAALIGADPRTDLALVKLRGIKKERFKAIALGDSERVRVGEGVLAVGNPLGLNHTVTSGIVSALGRKDLGAGGKVLESEFIQTDASINPGNSGGPLINLRGEVIGINTLINTQGQNIGFAIPINIVKSLLPQLHETGYVVRTWLGVRVQRVTPMLATSFGMREPLGALISEIVGESPATRSGLQEGDIILSFNNVKIRDSDQLSWLVSTGGTRDTLPVELLRGGERVRLALKLEALPGQDAPRAVAQGRQTSASEVNQPLELGLEVKALDDALARKLGAREARGVVITRLATTSPARGAGLRERDVITEIGLSTIASTADFDAALAAARSGEVVRMKIVRGGRAIYVAFER